MILINYHISFYWAFALASLNSVAISNAQSQFPNPFAQQPAQAAPAAAAQNPLAGAGAAPQSSAYPNPFTSQAGGAAGAAPSTSQPAAYPNPFAPPAGAAAGGATQPSAYPNPFTSQAGGAAGGATQPSAYPNPFALSGGGATSGGSTSGVPSPASLDPANTAGTCCCDPKKTFQAAATPQAPGGCCAAGNKWGCSCQDGGSFLHNPLTCPALHRNSRITPSGPTFELFCNVQTHRQDLKVDHADTFLDCVDSCGATAGCVGVDFDKVAQQCYYKSEYMDENTTGAVNNDIDSASMPPLACPDISKYRFISHRVPHLCFSLLGPSADTSDLDGQVRTIGGVPFKLSCDKSVSTSTGVFQPGITTVDACTQQCASQPTCQGMNFRASDQVCWLHTAYQNRKSNSLSPLRSKETMGVSDPVVCSASGDRARLVDHDSGNPALGFTVKVIGNCSRGRVFSRPFIPASSVKR